jgi:hypothetical protein
LKAKTSRRWSLAEHARNIHILNINLKHVGDEQYVLLQSDVHWDNPKALRDKFTEHLDEARERDAPVLDNGDFFCAMQGKWDKRANKNDLRPEHQKAEYLDALVSTATEALAPYADLLTVRGQGNHETGILKHHETNLTERLVERLKQKNPAVALGGYSGFIVFRIRYNESRTRPFKMFYHHGYGGGGPVTRGTIQTNRMAVFLADADLVWTGHTHDTWTMPIARVRLNQDCTAIEHTRQEHIRTAGYKEEYGDGWGGWHIERGGAPKPVGAVWLRFRYDNAKGNRDRAVTYDVIEAK